MALLKLDSPVPRRRAGEPRMQEVICGIRQGLYCRICAGPRENADVPTLEGIGMGHPLPPCPLHLRQMGVYTRVHRRWHEKSYAQRPHRSQYPVHPRIASVCGE